MALDYQKNYYEILDCTVDSTADDIKTAYRKLARKYHPDVNKTPEAINLFKDVIEAYKILSNPVEREKYNILKGYFKSAQNFSKNSTPNCTKNYGYSKQKTTDYKEKTTENKTKTTNKNFANNIETNKKENLKTSANQQETETKISKKQSNKTFFDKIIDNLKKINSSRKDITTEVVITPEEALNGCKRVINVLTTNTCPKCYGKRFINSHKCPECKGKGEISTKRKITVTIPKGVKNGAILRLKGEGAGAETENCGDLLLLIKVSTPERLKIEKLNVYYNVAVTPYEAALGEEILINLFNEKIKLKLPPNTCSGQKFRLAHEGLKKNGKVGDLIVTISIEFSNDLSEDEICLYKKLKNLSKRKHDTSKN